MLFCFGYANGQTIYVNANASGLNNGTNWGNAYTNLSAALTSATAGTKIWVAAGVYKPTSGTDRNASFIIPSGVKVYGGFIGNETSLLARNVIANTTTLSGNIGNTASALDNSIHIVMMLNCDTATVLDGFTVNNGYAEIKDSLVIGGVKTYRSKGAGLYIYGGMPKVLNCIFSGHISDVGGGIYMCADSSVLMQTTFTNNDCTHAAGVFALNSKSVFDSCTFSNNITWLVDGHGGALYNDSSSLRITRCVFNANQGTAGGAIYNANGKPFIDSCVFKSNSAFQASNFYSYGGAVYNYHSDAKITRCIFRKNKSGSGNDRGFGGGIYNEYCSPVITLCTFDSNYAYGGGTSILPGMGGGMFSNFGTPLIYNCLFIDNMTKYPNGSFSSSGGLHNNYSNAIVSNCTFYSHTGSTTPYHFVNQYGDPKTYNCIFWNVGPNPILNYYHVKNCIVEGVSPDTVNNIYNTAPMFNNPALNDFSINMCSPALNTGANNLYPGNLGTDLAYQLNTRLQDGAVDIGAYESSYKTAGISASIADAVSCGLSNTYFVAKTKGDSISYKWQVKQGNRSFVDIITTNTDTLFIQSPNAGMAGWQYRLIVTSCNGIVTDTSNIAQLKLVPLPNPTISISNRTLYTGAFAAYQWYKDSTAIAGAVTDSLVPTQGGVYYVYVTDSNGCSNYSFSQIVFNVHIANAFEKQHISIYPNPTHTSLTIGGISNGTLVQLKDLLGRQVICTIALQDKIELNTIPLTSGHYLLVLITPDGAVLKENVIKE